jgi:hypothetical protein
MRKGGLHIIVPALFLLFVSLQPVVGREHPTVSRDPFTSNLPKAKMQSPPPGPTHTVRTDVAPPDKTFRLVALPPFSVTGIVSTAGVRLAIVDSRQGTQIVWEGGRVFAYTVRRISSEAIIVEREGKMFRLPLNPDFG